MRHFIASFVTLAGLFSTANALATVPSGYFCMEPRSFNYSSFSSGVSISSNRQSIFSLERSSSNDSHITIGFFMGIVLAADQNNRMILVDPVTLNSLAEQKRVPHFHPLFEKRNLFSEAFKIDVDNLCRQ